MPGGRQKGAPSTPRQRAASAVAAKLARSRLTPPSYEVRGKHWSTVCGNALSWLVPWSLDEYPGVEGAVRALLAGRVSIDAFKRWRAGKDPMPDWFRDILIAQVEGRVARGRALLDELRAYRQPTFPNSGLVAVDPATGRDRRHRIGRTRRDAASQSDPA